MLYESANARRIFLAYRFIDHIKHIARGIHFSMVDARRADNYWFILLDYTFTFHLHATIELLVINPARTHRIINNQHTSQFVTLHYMSEQIITSPAQRLTLKRRTIVREVAMDVVADYTKGILPSPVYPQLLYSAKWNSTSHRISDSEIIASTAP